MVWTEQLIALPERGWASRGCKLVCSGRPHHQCGRKHSASGQLPDALVSLLTFLSHVCLSVCISGSAAGAKHRSCKTKIMQLFQ